MMSLFLHRDMAKQLVFLLLCFYIRGCNAGVVPRNFRHSNDVMSMSLEQSKEENEFLGNDVPTSRPRIQKNDTLIKAEPVASLSQSSSVNSSGLLNSNGGTNSSELDSRISKIPTLSTPRLNVTGNTSEGSEVASNQLSGIELPSKNSSGTLNSNSRNNSSQLDSKSFQIPTFSTVRPNITGNASKESEPVSNQLSGIELSIFNSSVLFNLSTGNNSSEADSRSFVMPLPSTAKPNVTGNVIEEFEVVTGNFGADEIQLNEDSGSNPIPASASDSIQSELSNNTKNVFTSDSSSDSMNIANNRSFSEVSNETDTSLQSEEPEKSLNETGVSKINLNESNSNISLSLFSNETEEGNNLEFSENINETVEETNGTSLRIDVGNIETGISGELENTASENESEGLLSIFGFDVLKNSEVAKNAVMAMEVFNLTDSSLTDHIIEDKEFHGFLDLVVPISDDSRDLNSTSVPLVFNSTDENLNSPERVDENNKNSLNVPSLMETETNLPDLLLNSTELKNVNETLKLTNVTEHIEERNETVILNITTKLNGTDFTESSVIEKDSNTTSNVAPKCPPPGICLFWFLSQDTCAVNSHCLGSRICCRIRCSKTCVEIS